MPIQIFFGFLKRLTFNRSLLFVISIMFGNGAAQSKEVTFVTLEYPPFASESMEGDGGIIRLLRMALDGKDWQIKVVFLPWARAQREVASGLVDGALPLWPKEAIDFGVTPSQAVFESQLGFYVRKSDYQLRETSIGQMRGKKVCAVRAYGYPPSLSNAGVNLDEGSGDEMSLKKLAVKRCDYAVLERAVGEYLLSTDKDWRLDAPVQWKGPAFASLHLYIGVVPGKPHSARLLADINEGIKAMQKDQRLRALANELSLNIPLTTGPSTDTLNRQ